MGGKRRSSTSFEPPHRRQNAMDRTCLPKRAAVLAEKILAWSMYYSRQAALAPDPPVAEQDPGDSNRTGCRLSRSEHLLSTWAGPTKSPARSNTALAVGMDWHVFPRVSPPLFFFMTTVGSSDDCHRGQASPRSISFPPIHFHTLVIGETPFSRLAFSLFSTREKNNREFVFDTAPVYN